MEDSYIMELIVMDKVIGERATQNASRGGESERSCPNQGSVMPEADFLLQHIGNQRDCLQWLPG